jgi:hypothetical protein
LTALAGSGLHNAAGLTQTVAGGDLTIGYAGNFIILTGVGNTLASGNFIFA